ncbi:hypothetical protein [Brevundimonas naejangsanensis]|uniref:hypothetical protein n=1 Tax=Brevundimonas naejangsanensis TaxID=588932 RepID=UPI0032085CDA
MTADLSALIARLEAAEVGSRELDAAVTVALQLDARGVTVDDHEYLRATVRSDECAPGTYWRCARSGMSLRTADPVTTSLDAALALADRVLEGWLWTVGTERRGSDIFASADAYDVNGDGDAEWFCQTEATTPSLALCIAILRAKQGEGE